jgi:sec-independent protein translocase protein TatB
MFEFDAGKFIIIGIVALIVIGPKELPRVMRQLGQAVGKLRRISSEFQQQFMEAMREADLEDLKAEAAKISEAARLDKTIDPLAGIREELAKPATSETSAINETSAIAESSAIAVPNVPVHAEPLAEVMKDDPQSALRSIELRNATPEPIPAHEIASSEEAANVDGAEALEAQGPAADITPLRKRG